MPGGINESHGPANTYIAEVAVTYGKAVIAGTNAGEVNLAGANAGTIIGVTAMPVAIGEAVTIIESGLVRVTSGAAVTLNALVTTDASARFVTATTGENVHGQALTASGGADEEILIKLGVTGLQLAP